METFKYISKDTNNSLLSKYDYEEVKNKIIIQTTKYDVVHLFHTIGDFDEFYNKLSPEDKIYHEIILQDDIQKFRIDIDVKGDLYDELSKSYTNVTSLVDLIINDCIIIVDILMNTKSVKYHIFDSSDDTKHIISRHVVFDIYFKTCIDVKVFYRRVMEDLMKKYDKNVLSVIDGGIYKSIQGFRMPHNRKYNDTRVKKELTDDLKHVMEGMIKPYRELDKPLVDVSMYYEKHNTYTPCEISDATLKVVLEKSKCYHEDEFRVRTVIDNKIIFDRTKSGNCCICNRVHENENSIYIVVYNNRFRIYCRRNEHDYIEHDLLDSKLNDNNMKLRRYLSNKNCLENMVMTSNNTCKSPYDIETYELKNVRPYDFKDKKVLIINSNVKTSKTKMLNKHLDDYKTLYTHCVFVSFRILFSVELNSKFSEFISYQNVKDKKISLAKYKKIIIQLDSLYKLSIDAPIDLLILDEIESILSHFSSPHIKNIKLIWELFEFILRYSKKVICMDANISDRSMELIRSVYGDENIRYINNTYSSIKCDSYYITFKYKVFISILGKYLSENKKIIIPTNSLKYAKVLNNFISSNYADKKIAIYTSETCDLKKRDDLSDINNSWTEYDVVIYTPCITAGVSFENKYFDYLFGFFTNTSCDIYTIYQMLFRVRNLNENKMYIMFSIYTQQDTVSTSKIDLVEELKYTFKHLHSEVFDYKIEFKDGAIFNVMDNDNNFLKLWLNNKLIKNISNMYIVYEFVKMLKKNKCRYEFLYVIPNNFDEITIDVKTEIENIKHDDNLKILNVRDISYETYTLLDIENLLTEEEKLMKKRYNLRKWFGLDNSTEMTMKFLMTYNTPAELFICFNLYKVRNFTEDYNAIIKQYTGTNNSYSIIGQEDYIMLKVLIDIIKLYGLDVYDTTKEINVSNITDNNKKNIKNKLKIMGVKCDKNVCLIEILGKIINKYWGMILHEYNDVVKICRSPLYNTDYPVKCNTW